MEENTVRKRYFKTSTTVVIPAGVERLKIITSIQDRVVDQCTKWIQPDNTLVTLGGVTPFLGTNTTPVSSPTLVAVATAWRTLARSTNLHQWTMSAHIAMIDKQGVLYTFGANNNGQLGNLTTTAQNIPVVVANTAIGPQPYKDVWCGGAAATGYTVARDFKDRVYVWGLISGDGTAPPKSSPVLVSFPSGVTRWVQVMIAGPTTRAAMVLQGDNGLWYALGSHPSFGTGGVNQSWSTPTLVLNSSNFIACVGISENIVAWKGNGGTYWMSSNIFTGAESSPVQVSCGNGNIVNFWMNPYMISDPRVHVQDSTGAVFTFGTNTHGQVGDGTVTTRSSWVQVAGLPNNVVFAYTGHSGTAGQAYCYFLTAAGAVYSCGWNAHGGLGTNDVIPRSTATLVVGLGAVSVSEVVTGYGAINRAHFVTTAGQIYSVGLNTNGLLGVGDTTPRSSPTLVSGGRTWVTVCSAYRNYDANPLNIQRNNHGTDSTYLEDVNGNIYAIGFNLNGQASNGAGGSGQIVNAPAICVRPHYVADTDMYEDTTWIDVVPGQSYTLNLLALSATFGSTVIGQFVDTAIIEYDS